MSMCNTEKRLNGRKFAKSKNNEGKCLGTHTPLSSPQWVADRECWVAAQRNVIIRVHTTAVETYRCGLSLAAYTLASEISKRLVASLYFGRGGRLLR